METQKKFQKKTLNSDDYKGAEKGAKAVKDFFGAITGAVLVYVNKDNIKVLVSGVADFAKKNIRR